MNFVDMNRMVTKRTHLRIIYITLVALCVLNRVYSMDDWREQLDEMAEDYLTTTANKDDAFSSITRTLVEGRSFFFDLFTSQTSDACKFKCKKGESSFLFL